MGKPPRSAQINRVRRNIIILYLTPSTIDGKNQIVCKVLMLHYSIISHRPAFDHDHTILYFYTAKNKIAVHEQNF